MHADTFAKLRMHRQIEVRAVPAGVAAPVPDSLAQLQHAGQSPHPLQLCSHLRRLSQEP